MGLIGPKVSVVMPVLNGERYLRYSIESILKQTYTDFELLIVNDGSTDSSLEIIKSYSDPRIRLINNEKNLGLVKTRNLGFYEAKGIYIALLDCDDIAYPTRLAEQIAAMDKDSELGLLGSWADCIDEYGKNLSNISWRPEISSSKIPATLLFMNCFATSSVLIRKQALPDTWYREEYPVAEDYDLYVRITQKFKASNLPNFLAAYRSHNKGISKIKKQQMEECVRNIIIYELQNIGIQPTKRELDIHQHMAWPSLKCNAALIEEAESWLLGLQDANDQIGYFEQAPFIAELGMRWFLLCNNSSQLGPWIWRKFWNSALFTQADINLKQKSKFAVKCLIRYQRHGFQ